MDSDDLFSMTPHNPDDNDTSLPSHSPDNSFDMYEYGVSGDTVYGIDTDDDGIPDAFDMDGDGVPDAFDTNDDGVPDAFDTDGDNQPDSFINMEDTNHDGIPDMITHTVLSDTDGDGIIDTIVSQFHQSNDGTGFHSLFPSDNMNTDSGDAIVGDPQDDIEHWEFQGNTNRCAVFSQMFAIEDLLGIDLNPDQLTQIAEENGWYDDGTPPNCMGNLLEYYGLKTETGSGTIADIQDCLSQGGKVIVGVDSSEIWEGPDHEDMYSPGMQADHAVEVIGLDYSDPDHPMVILNDSGTPDGAGEIVPMDQFMDAWQDSGYLMVEAYK